MRPLQKKREKKKNKKKKQQTKKRGVDRLPNDLFIDFYISLQRSYVNLLFSKFSKQKKKKTTNKKKGGGSSSK